MRACIVQLSNLHACMVTMEQTHAIMYLKGMERHPEKAVKAAPTESARNVKKSLDEYTALAHKIAVLKAREQTRMVRDLLCRYCVVPVLPKALFAAHGYPQEANESPGIQPFSAKYRGFCFGGR